MNVGEEINRTSQYGQQLEGLVASRQLALSNDREIFLVGYWSLLIEFHRAILILLDRGLYGSAFALLRPVIEAWLRIHLVVSGTEAEFIRIKDDTYRTDFAAVATQLDEAFGLAFFEKSLHKNVRDALHSYAHAGTFQVARRFTGTQISPSHSDGEQLNVIEASTTAVFMATVLLTKRLAFKPNGKK